MSLRDRLLEVVDRRRPRVGTGHAGEAEHRGDVRDVFRPRLDELRRVDEIVIAVGHAEPALAQPDHVAVGLLRVLLDADLERSVDADALVGPERAGEVGAAGDGGDPVERRLQRGEALRLDRRLVHEGRIEGADAPRIGVGRRTGPRRILDDRARPVARQVVEDLEAAEARPVGGDRGPLRPAAVGVGVEIVARPDRPVHAGGVEAERAILRRGRLGDGGLPHREREQRNGDGECAHGFPEINDLAIVAVALPGIRDKATDATDRFAAVGRCAAVIFLHAFRS